MKKKSTDSNTVISNINNIYKASEFKAGKSLRLMFPDDKAFKSRFKDISYNYTRDYMESKLRTVISAIMSGKMDVEIANPDDNIASSLNAFNEILRKQKTNIVKNDYAVLYSIITHSISNECEIIENFANPIEKKLLAELCEKGALLSEYVFKMFNLKYEYRYSRNSWDYDHNYSTWGGASQNVFFRMFTIRIDGYNPDAEDRWSDTTVYFLPKPAAVCYFLSKKLGRKKDERLSTFYGDFNFLKNDEIKGRTVFTGTDFYSYIPTIRNLVMSGIIAPPKQKIGVQLSKKLNSLVSLSSLPSFGHLCDNDRAVLTLSLFLSPAMLSLGVDLSNREWFVEVDKFLPSPSDLAVNAWIKNSLVKLPTYFLYYKRHQLLLLYFSLKTCLATACFINNSDWIDIEAFRNNVDLDFCRKGVSIMVPDRYDENTSSVTDAQKIRISPMEFKKHFHDQFVNGFLLTFAAIGLLDLLCDSDNIITHIRLNRMGKWFMGIDKDYPGDIAQDTDPTNDFSCDDSTTLILVKNPDSAYLPILKQFAVKVSSTRYALDQKKILKGCRNKSMVKNNIERLKDFVIPKPGKEIKNLFTTLLNRCDLVNKTPGGTTYTLLDISSENQELLQLITENKDIRDNSLRVEGYRLLVKTTWLDSFYNILRNSGFPI